MSGAPTRRERVVLAARGAAGGDRYQVPIRVKGKARRFCANRSTGAFRDGSARSDAGRFGVQSGQVRVGVSQVRDRHLTERGT